MKTQPMWDSPPTKCLSATCPEVRQMACEEAKSLSSVLVRSVWVQTTFSNLYFNLAISLSSVLVRSVWVQTTFSNLYFNLAISLSSVLVRSVLVESWDIFFQIFILTLRNHIFPVSEVSFSLDYLFPIFFKALFAFFVFQLLISLRNEF